MFEIKHMFGGVLILNLNQQKILSLLKSDPYMSQQAIANEIGLSRPSVANLITQLIDMGYIIGKAYVLNDTKDDLIICVGAANVDYKLISMNPIKFDTSNPAISHHSMGGVMRNIAENLGRLNCETSLLTLVGSDGNGDALVNHLKDYCHTNKIQKVITHNTGSYTAVLNNDGQLLCGLADMEICNLMTQDWISQHEPYLKQASKIVVDTNVQDSCIDYLIKFAQTYDIELYLAGVSTVKMNRLPRIPFKATCGIFNLDESRAYFNTNQSAQELAKRWIDHGLEHVIITQGVKETIYATKNEIHSLDVKPNKTVVDVTGAGDSFIAGTLFGLMNKYSYLDSIKFGLLNSYHTVASSESVRSNLTAQHLLKETEKF